MWLLRNNPPTARLETHPQHNASSFHVVITGVGRTTVLRTLRSLEGQLNDIDYLTILFDGKDEEGVLPKVTRMISRATFKCTVNIQVAKQSLGHYGHGRRQQMKHLAGHFVIHSDDDNFFQPDAFENYRKHAVDRDTLYVFQSGVCDNQSLYVWKDKDIIGVGNIDTANGVIPSWLNTRSHWGQTYCGDGIFYDMAKRLSIKTPVFIPVITTIYTSKPGACRGRQHPW
eukprot:gene10991-4950_t